MIEIIKIVLPATLVLITAYFLMDKFLKEEEKKRHYQLQQKSIETILPIRLRAYERLVLFLERTSPAHLLVSQTYLEVDAVTFRKELVKKIRAEFEHNLAQQLYVSSEAWQEVQVAFESLLVFINTTASECKEGDSAVHLATLILENYHSATEGTPSEHAINKLKEEVKQLF